MYGMLFFFVPFLLFKDLGAAGVDLLWSVPVVFVICLRYLMILNCGESDGDPIEIILKDKRLLLLCLVFFAVLLFSLYGMETLF